MARVHISEGRLASVINPTKPDRVATVVVVVISTLRPQSAAVIAIATPYQIVLSIPQGQTNFVLQTALR